MRHLLSPSVIPVCALLLLGADVGVRAAVKLPPSEDASHPHVKVELISDVENVVAGTTFHAGVHFRMDPHWHVYWRHPGEAGLPTKVEWEGVNAVFSSSPLPAPSVFGEGESSLTTYGYESELLVTTRVEVPAGASGTSDVIATVEYLACEKECIPGEAALQKSVKIAPTLKAAAPATQQLFAQQLPQLPVANPFGLALTVTPTPLPINTSFKMALAVKPCPLPDVACAHPLLSPLDARQTFIPDAMEFITNLKAVAFHKSPTEEGVLVLEAEGRTSSHHINEGDHLKGVLRLQTADGKPLWVEVNQVIPPAALVSVDKAQLEALPAPNEDLSLWEVLLLALLGGIILNLMPCVFPVLALKVYAFAAVVQEDKRHILWHAAAYVAGIVGSLLALGGVVIGLKAAGHAVGWGFQFQEPLFVALVGGVLTAFALNLFGVFEVGVPAGTATQKVDSSSGLQRSVGEGVLAVLLATPCSAPFLGTAVGYALASPPVVILAVFTVLGLGLALPFVLLVMVPGMARLLPRPGPWMMHGRQLLGFFLLATVVWLLWVLGQLTGVNGMAGALAFLTAVGMASWLWGLTQHGALSGRRVGLVAVAALLGGVGSMSLPRHALPSGAPQVAAATGWRAFDEDAIAQALSTGHPVFVDFTADWCLTCKVNEQMVLARDGVQRAFGRHQVALFKADWTRRDEGIRRVLARHGKAGVPMYLLYSPLRPGQPQVLSEVLTVDGLVEDVRAAAEVKASAL